MLVLDEPAEHLDLPTADALTADLLAATEGRTTVLVTHRLAGLEAVDEVIVLDAGRVVQRGRYEELRAVGGPLRDMALREEEAGNWLRCPSRLLGTHEGPPRHSVGTAPPARQTSQPTRWTTPASSSVRTFMADPPVMCIACVGLRTLHAPERMGDMRKTPVCSPLLVPYKDHRVTPATAATWASDTRSEECLTPSSILESRSGDGRLTVRQGHRVSGRPSIHPSGGVSSPMCTT